MANDLDQFQFLIGRLKTPLCQRRAAMATAVFQFLIGRLKTGKNELTPCPRRQVSIPYR
ncbi:MAG: hypothetical protein PWR01_399 [Clostridiales bacterium]|nr:hypothetical protein [Clostridiales bacterium]